MRTTKPLVIGVALVTAVALAGCSRSAGGGGTSTAGSELKVMVIESMTGLTGVDQTAPKAAEAAAKSINAAGGVDGRTITVLSCDTASDPNKATQCARDAVNDGVIAVVGSFEPLGGAQIVSVLEQAKIAYLAPIPVGKVEYTSPVSFPVVGGSAAGNFGMVSLAQKYSCKNVVTWSDSAIDDGLGQETVASLTKIGIKATLIDLPTSTTDVSPMVSQGLSGNPDCLLYDASGLIGSQLFAAVRNAGSTAKIITAEGSLLPPFLKALGAQGDGIIATADAPLPSASELADFNADLAKYSPDVTDPSYFTLNAWYSVKALQQAVAGLSDVSSAGLLAHLATMDDVTLPGLPTVSFTTPLSATLFPRMFSPKVQEVVAKDGAYVSVDPTWVDVTSFLPAAQ